MPKYNEHKWEFDYLTTKRAMQNLNLSYNKLALLLAQKGVQITPQQINAYFRGLYRMRPEIWHALDFLRQECLRIKNADQAEIKESVGQYL